MELIDRSYPERTRVVLIRHAEIAEQAQGRCYGRLDLGLSRRGVRHARELACVLKGTRFNAIYTSPCRRAVETAECLASVSGLVPIEHGGLHELDFGELEGLTYEEIERRHPTLYERWMSDPTSVTFPGGESSRDLQRRSLAALRSLRKQHAGELIGLVTHAGVIRTLLADALGMPNGLIFRIDQAYCGVSIVDWIEGRPLVRVVNASYQ